MTHPDIPPPIYALPPDLDPTTKPASCASGDEVGVQGETAAVQKEAQGEGVGSDQLLAVTSFSEL